MQRQREHPDPVPLDIVELEEHAKEHETKAPHATKYTFRGDKERVFGSLGRAIGSCCSNWH